MESPKQNLRHIENEHQQYVVSAIVFKDIGGLYRIQVGQRFTNQDMDARKASIVYCGRFLFTVYEDPDFLLVVWFSDEIHIHLDRQTTRFRGFERPDVIVEKTLYSERVTIRCAVSAHGVLGPYFIENDNGIPLTVTQKRYRNMTVPLFIQDLRRSSWQESLDR